MCRLLVFSIYGLKLENYLGSRVSLSAVIAILFGRKISVDKWKSPSHLCFILREPAFLPRTTRLVKALIRYLAIFFTSLFRLGTRYVLFKNILSPAL